MATEILPPTGLGPQAAARLTGAHQEQVSSLVESRQGRLALRVGSGCVALLPDTGSALEVAFRLVHPGEPGEDRGPGGRVRIALHRAALQGRETATVEPAVGEVRRLLERAAPGEVLATAAVQAGHRAGRVRWAPLSGSSSSAPEASGAEPAFRLLLDPSLGSAPAAGGRPMWYIAAAALLGAVLLVGTLAVVLLGS